MKYLFILNDPAYGTERSYNGLRLAGAVAKREGNDVFIFLIGDAVTCAVAGQNTPNGYYNLEHMLKTCASRGAIIGVCGSCIDARGIKEDALVAGAGRSTMEELADWTVEANKVLIF